MRRRIEIATVGVLLTLTVVFFWQHLFTGRIFARGDAFTYFYPYWHARNLALSSGRLPLWAPEIFMGVPFLANSQTGTLYPLNWLVMGFDAPRAFALSAALHVALGAVGMYTLARRTVKLSPVAALFAAVAFAYGGAVLGKVEQINQLQGIAWMPWLLWLAQEAIQRPKMILGLGAAFAMQLLAGHTQSAFIAGVGLGLMALWQAIPRLKEGWRQALWPLGLVAVGALLAVGLAAPQLLPTFELTALSNRAGGLTPLEAVSFSFRPQVVGRGLLPGYSAPPLFSEFNATIGVTGLLLAAVGAWAARHDRTAQGYILLAGVGLFLALGAYNPVYWLLVRFVPGFDLFRVPARWLILTSMGGALLGGVGIDALRTGDDSVRRGALIGGAIVLVLAMASLGVGLVRDEVPGATVAPPLTWAAWIGVLAVAGGLVWQRGVIPQSAALVGLCALLVVELFAASLSMTFNRLSAPEAWTTQRPAMSTVLALDEGHPPGRVLSLSDIVFDPGDLRELEAIYGPGLSDDALFDFIVAAKQKEIIAPNIPLAWGISSVDGYGGGILPTADYVAYTSLFIDTEEPTNDGRLRENLDTVPDWAWLEATNTRWVITDKVFDQWIDGVYHDLQFPQQVAAGSPPVEAVLPVPFTATAVNVVGVGSEATGTLTIHPTAGEAITLELPGLPAEGTPTEESLITVSWGDSLEVERLTVELSSGAATLRGMTVVDERTGAFSAAQMSADMRLAHSGDVKVYEYTRTQPRAYVVCRPAHAPTPQAAREIISADPHMQVIVGAAGEATCDGAQPAAVISQYEAESLTIDTQTNGTGAYLIVLDAAYPGWEATVNGEGVAVREANGMFRAVPLPGGEASVELTYTSTPLRQGLVVFGVTAVLMTVTGFVLPGDSRRAS